MKKTLLFAVALIMYSVSYAAVYPMPIIMGNGGSISVKAALALYITFNLLILLGMIISRVFFHEEDATFFKDSWGDMNIGTMGLITINGIALFILCVEFIESLL